MSTTSARRAHRPSRPGSRSSLSSSIPLSDDCIPIDDDDYNNNNHSFVTNDDNDVADAVGTTGLDYNANNNNNATLMSSTSLNSPYGGGMYGGMGVGGGMMMPPMMPPGMMMMGGGMGGGPFASVYQALYGLQNVVFSISQAVQLVGMNQHVLQQAWESINQMVEHAVTTFSEMRALEANAQDGESEEDKQRRRRLKALRYALVLGGSWLAYKVVRQLLFQKDAWRRGRRQQQQRPHLTRHGSPQQDASLMYPTTSPYDTSLAMNRMPGPNGYYGGGGFGTGSYGSGMYGGGFSSGF